MKYVILIVMLCLVSGVVWADPESDYRARGLAIAASHSSVVAVKAANPSMDIGLIRAAVALRLEEKAADAAIAAFHTEQAILEALVTDVEEAVALEIP